MKLRNLGQGWREGRPVRLTDSACGIIYGTNISLAGIEDRGSDRVMLKTATERIKRGSLLVIAAVFVSIIISLLAARSADALVLDTVRQATKPVFRILRLDEDDSPSNGRARSSQAPDTTAPQNSASRQGGKAPSNSEPSSSASDTKGQISPQEAAPELSQSDVQALPIDPAETEPLMEPFEEVAEQGDQAEPGIEASQAVSAAAMPAVPVKMMSSDSDAYSWYILGIAWQWWFVVTALAGAIILHLIHSAHIKSAGDFGIFSRKK